MGKWVIDVDYVEILNNTQGIKKGGIMTDQEIKEIAFTPMNEAWKVIRLTQNLKPDDDKKWKEYRDAHDAFCKKYDYNVHGSYGYYLGMAIMAIVDDIAKENAAEETT